MAPLLLTDTASPLESLIALQPAASSVFTPPALFCYQSLLISTSRFLLHLTCMVSPQLLITWSLCWLSNVSFSSCLPLCSLLRLPSVLNSPISTLPHPNWNHLQLMSVPARGCLVMMSSPSAGPWSSGPARIPVTALGSGIFMSGCVCMCIACVLQRALRE